MANTNLLMLPLGSGELRSVFMLDVSKIYYISFKPETEQQTAKLIIDFGVSQKMFEKREAEQVYEALMNQPHFKAIDAQGS